MDAFEAGLGGLPADVRVEPCVERGETGPVLVDIAEQPGDLLVIGTGRRAPLGRALRKSVGRYCLAHARCPVLAVPPSALMDEMAHGFRPWSLRGRHVTVPDIPEHAPESLSRTARRAWGLLGTRMRPHGSREDRNFPC